MLAEIPPEGPKGVMDELTRTQPHPVMTPEPTGEHLSRRTRLLRTIIFGLALVLGIVAWITVAGESDDAPANTALIVSPTGHEPNRRNDDPNVSVSWSGVEGAAGYWWAILEDPFDLPSPVIRPSGDDRRVFFRFQGRAYFVLRTAHRVDGELRWSDAKIYGPILVGRQARASGTPGTSPGIGSSPGPGGTGSGLSGPGGSGGSAPGSSGTTPTPDPRLAGQPGSCSGSSCGSAGQPGQPAQQPGGGAGGSRPSNSEGTPGQPGPSGAPG